MQIKRNDSEIYTMLKKIAQNSPIAHKHAAMLLKNNKVYSSGYNRFSVNNSTTHAEMSVFNKFPKKYGNGLDVLVIRIDKKLNFVNSRPCNNCINNLKKIGIRKIFYSNDSGIIVSEFVDTMPLTHISAGTRYKLSI